MSMIAKPPASIALPLDDETTRAIARTLHEESRHYVAPIGVPIGTTPIP
jgi:hypothetical protein